MLEIKKKRINESPTGETKLEIVYLEEYPKTLYLLTAPTANCQLFTIGNIKALFQLNTFNTKENFLEVLGYIINNIVYKQMLLIDINSVYIEKFKNFISGFYKAEPIVTKYKNSNGTDMAIILTHLNVELIIENYRHALRIEENRKK